MPAKASKKAWEALRPKVGADKIWRDSKVGDSLTTWEHHFANYEQKKKGIGGFTPLYEVMHKYADGLNKAVQGVHDKLNSVLHKATRAKLQAFKTTIANDLAVVAAAVKAEAEQQKKAKSTPPPVPPRPPKPSPQARPSPNRAEDAAVRPAPPRPVPRPQASPRPTASAGTRPTPQPPPPRSTPPRPVPQARPSPNQAQDRAVPPAPPRPPRPGNT